MGSRVFVSLRKAVCLGSDSKPRDEATPGPAGADSGRETAPLAERRRDARPSKTGPFRIPEGPWRGLRGPM